MSWDSGPCSPSSAGTPDGEGVWVALLRRLADRRPDLAYELTAGLIRVMEYAQRRTPVVPVVQPPEDTAP